MDTISRESSPSYLPLAGLIVGIVGVLLGGIALANASKASKAAIAAGDAAAAQTSRIEAVESTAASAQQSAEAARSANAKTVQDVNGALAAVGAELGKTNGEIAKLQEAISKGVKTGGSTNKSTGPVVAGPDEYVIKAGDTFAKIARAQGVSLGDIQAVNPGVDASKLKVGQKIKLPKK